MNRVLKEYQYPASIGRGVWWLLAFVVFYLLVVMLIIFPVALVYFTLINIVLVSTNIFGFVLSIVFPIYAINWLLGSINRRSDIRITYEGVEVQLFFFFTWWQLVPWEDITHLDEEQRDDFSRAVVRLRGGSFLFRTITLTGFNKSAYAFRFDNSIADYEELKNEIRKRARILPDFS